MIEFAIGFGLGVVASIYRDELMKLAVSGYDAVKAKLQKKSAE